MAKTISEAFDIFHQRLTPNTTEANAAARHRASIENCLKTNHKMTHFFKTGSNGNGTSISGYSDTDYFAVLPTDQFTTDSYYSLTKVKDTLDTRFPRTGVRISTPAIVVPFGQYRWEDIEVTPADYVKKENGYDIYEIADGNRGWMKASPDAHNAYVRTVNTKLSNKVKPLIRFMKAWKYHRDVPINSFFLELRTTKFASGENSIVYSIDIKNLIKNMLDSKLASIQDPMGVSGLIAPCKTNTYKQDALTKLETAYNRAVKAYELEQAGKIQDAFAMWNTFFNGKFPAYS